MRVDSFTERACSGLSGGVIYDRVFHGCHSLGRSTAECAPLRWGNNAPHAAWRSAWFQAFARSVQAVVSATLRCGLAPVEAGVFSIVRLRVEHMAGGTRGAHLPQQSLHRTATLEPPLYWYYENTTQPCVRHYR